MPRICLTVKFQIQADFNQRPLLGFVVLVAFGNAGELEQFKRSFHIDERIVEHLEQFGGIQFIAFCIGIFLYGSADFRVHSLGRVDFKIMLQNVCDAALSRLAVDTDQLFVFAPDIRRVDMQVRHFPLDMEQFLRLRQTVDSLADRILMGT